jgi:hypothetical protein
MSLEAERKKLLLDEEERWRQKSRAIWIKSGDKIQNFSIVLQATWRNKKFIWEIKDEAGRLHTGQEAIKEEDNNFFKSFFHDT